MKVMKKFYMIQSQHFTKLLNQVRCFYRLLEKKIMLLINRYYKGTDDILIELIIIKEVII